MSTLDFLTFTGHASHPADLRGAFNLVGCNEKKSPERKPARTDPLAGSQPLINKGNALCETYENLTPLTRLFLSCMDERDVVTNVCWAVGGVLVR